MQQEVPAKGGPCGPKFKSRYILAILASAAVGLVYGIRVGLNVVIVVMVNHTAIDEATNVTHKSHAPDGTSSTLRPKEDGPFEWDTETQGFILSSYFCGYIFSQIPGGRMAELLSAKWVMCISVAINSLGSFLTAPMSKLHYWALAILRVLQGLGCGVMFPCCHVLLSRWAPPTERGFISSVVYSGAPMGTVIATLMSGVLANHLGWESVFYAEGIAAALWLPLWVWLAADTPAKQKLITTDERDFIIASLRVQKEGEEKPRPPMPWKAVFKSRPFWAILVAHTCGNWNWYLNLIELPQYMRSVLNFNIEANGFLTALPYLMMWIFGLTVAKILDTLTKKKKLTITRVRKIATSIATVTPIITCILLCIIEGKRALAVAVVVVGGMSGGGAFSGYLANHIDIAPNFAGTLLAITNTAATIPGILVPHVVGAITREDDSIRSWRKIFYICIAMYSTQFVVYLMWASGEIQPWNDAPQAPENQETSRDTK